VILVDTNVLLYARVGSLPQNIRARGWLDGRINEGGGVAMPWPSLLGFARVATNRRIFERPLSAEAAWMQVRDWLSAPSVWIPSPGDRHADILGDLILQNQAVDKLIPDAHLAALAIEHGLRLCSTDGDFGRFRGLQWENPLLA
jgi:toxin-antitoxin system PIN domain toxin